MTAHVWIAGLAVALLIVSPARAEVVSSTPAGFVSRHVVGVAATPAVVYAAIVREVGRWWDPAHTFSGDAAPVDGVLAAQLRRLQNQIERGSPT